jgi:D-glycero-alpha-D-manno-heptose-7-phosphate kinase
LCDSGVGHESGDIHLDQREQMRQADVHKKAQANVELTYQIRNHLLRGRLLQFGQALDQAWQLKRHFGKKISSSALDAIYDNALRNGAVGGKLLGAGGGGYFLFYVPPFRKHELISSIESAGLRVQPFRFESQGLRTWCVRERRNHSAADAS